jgi:hypothetical protein
MSQKGRKWISIAPDAREGEASEKKVVSSNFKDIRTKSIDESAIGVTRVTYQASGMWKDIFSFQGTDYDTLSVPYAGRMQGVGSPEIAHEGLFVAIPENAEVKEVKVLSKKEKELDGEYYILPASKPVLEGEVPEHIPNKEIYESDVWFPGKYFEFLGTKHIAGRKVAHIIVYLLQYKPKSRKVKALESIVLEVVYETLAGVDTKARRRLLRPSPVDKMILDSQSIIEGEKLREEMEKGGDLDSSGLHDPNNEGEYLIITTNDLKNSVGTLASAKESEYIVRIVTKGEILREFPIPNECEAIREFLIYATSNWAEPPEWVVLAGDVDKIPTHITKYETYHPRLPPNLASDHYYADLSDDLTPEIVVSRLPVSNAQDMEKLCSLASSYSKKSGAWRNRILLTAYERTKPKDDYIDCKNKIASMIGTRFTVIKKYAGQSGKREVIHTLNEGVVIANYRGHGKPDRWLARNGLHAKDLRNLNNDDRTPLVFSVACWNACIDCNVGDIKEWLLKKRGESYEECFGETWVRNGKTVAFLGASRPSWTRRNHDFDEYLFDAVINQGLTKVGDIVNWAKTKLFGNFPPTEDDPGTEARDNIRMYLLLGDPSIDLSPP